MKYIFIFFICLFAYDVQAQLKPAVSNSSYNATFRKVKHPYKLSKEKWIGWSQVAVGSFLIGFRDRYEIENRMYFEQKWGSDPFGFWGSESWRMIYVNGDPSQGYKSRYHEWVGPRDFSKVSGDVGKLLLISGGITMTIGERQPLWHHAVNFGLSILVSSAFDRFGNSFRL